MGPPRDSGLDKKNGVRNASSAFSGLYPTEKTEVLQRSITAEEECEPRAGANFLTTTAGFES